MTRPFGAGGPLRFWKRGCLPAKIVPPGSPVSSFWSPFHIPRPDTPVMPSWFV